MTSGSTRGPGERSDRLARVFRRGRVNAVAAWVLVGLAGAVLVESLVFGDRLWAVFVAAVAVLVLVPPAVHRDWRVMLPWELLALALLPMLARAVLGATLGTFAYYLSIAGLALVVTVELHMFTPLRVTHWFAIAFVSLATLASVATWTIVRWLADRALGTGFLTTNEALMHEWTAVAVAGLAAGVLFDAYFRGRGSVVRRLLARVVG